MNIVEEKNKEVEKLRADHQEHLDKVVHTLARREKKIAEDIEKFNAEKVQAEADLQSRKQKLNEDIARLQKERDEWALAEKLKGFPAELVEGHKTCALCGNNMRPYVLATGAKLWACVAGNLAAPHDVIVVE